MDYAQAGVDISAGNALVEAIKPLARSTARPGSDSALGGFGALFDLRACGYRDPVLVAATDGVGTKLKIASDVGLYRTVGIDLVAMSVNDLVVQGAEPLFFLDYYASGKLEIAAARDVVTGIAEGCRQAGCALIGGETAEMPGLYNGKDFDLAGFAVGAVERDAILPSQTLGAGDVLLGLASSGLHSNGYSLVRRVMNRAGFAYDEAAPFSPSQSFGEALLAPTRIYVKQLLACRRDYPFAIKALAHITGGGLIENIPRVLPAALFARIDLSAIDVPAVFAWLQHAGKLAEREMLRTFNCGIGMVVIVDAGSADVIQSALTQSGEKVVRLGTLAERGAEDEPVQFAGRLQLG